MVRKENTRREGGIPLYGLYGDMPLDRVWLFDSSALNRVYNFKPVCPNQRLDLSWTSYGCKAVIEYIAIGDQRHLSVSI